MKETKKTNNVIQPLCGCRLGFALGLTWGLSTFALALTAHWFHFGNEIVHLIGTVYIGYKATVVGSLIGLAYGFVDFFIFGVILAFIYNSCCKHKSCCKKK